MAHCNVADKSLEIVVFVGPLCRVASIAVENPDLPRSPAERLPLVHQIVLTFLAFQIGQNWPGVD